MQRKVNILNRKNVQALYEITNIMDNGQVVVGEKTIVIYRVTPANIVACDDESKFKIYQAYLTCIRGFPDTIQVVIGKEKTDLNQQIEYYKAKILEIESMGLKLALKKYVEYLEELSKTNELYKTSHYFIIENVSRTDMQDIVEIFTNLKEFGVVASQITSKDEITKVLKSAMKMENT